MNNIVIGIEGLVGAGKTSICRELLNKIPNSILLHGGNIYRSIMYAIINSGIELGELEKKLSGADVKKIMDQFNIEIRIKNRESVMFMNGNEIDENDLQSKEASMAVSIVSGIANNKRLYEFGKKVIQHFQNKFNIILSSRDIMRMYPDADYHFLITASLEERIRRKYIQYKGKIEKEELKQIIQKRDELQRVNGYYNIYEKTRIIDVTDCQNVHKSAERVLESIYKIDKEGEN